jgi:L-alanine-DL-glutamate epimerase-like enolase superfamily enzyme
MINTGLGAAVEAHFLAAIEWMGKIEQESIGPLNQYDLIETKGNPIPDDLGLSCPRYEGGYLYPPDGPGLGIELNEETVRKFPTPGKEPVVLKL